MTKSAQQQAEEFRQFHAHTDKGRWMRLFFAFITGAVAMIIASPFVVAVWVLFIFVWECLVAPILYERVIEPLIETDFETAQRWVAGTNGFGAILFAFMPLIALSTGETLGVVLAVAWLGGTAIHIFVYIANSKLNLLVSIAAPLLVAIVGPALFLPSLLDAALVSAFTLLLFALGAQYSVDRQKMLARLDTQRDARTAAEEADRLKSQFLKTVSAEMRAPLNTILSHADALERALETGAARPESAHAIHEEGRALLAVINRVLEVVEVQARSGPSGQAARDAKADIVIA